MVGQATKKNLLWGLTAVCTLVAACDGQDKHTAPASTPAVAQPPKTPAPAPHPPPGEHGSAAQRRKAYLAGCEEGDGQACFALGEMVDQGMGGAQDPRRARALYEQACAFGSEEACDALGH